MSESHYLVPAQFDGLEKDLSHSIITETIEDADDWFVDAKERLLDVNNWKKISGIANVEFKLTDGNGRILSRRARRGDLIRIDIAGRGHEYEGGFEWAAIEAIEYDDYPDENMETFAMRLRPSADPMNKNNNVFLDFSESEATSTFVIERIGKKLSAYYHGRNEQGDLELVSVGQQHEPEIVKCAWLGLSDVECKALIKGFVD